MRWVLALAGLLLGRQAEGGGCPENTARMWSIHGGKVELLEKTEGKVMAKVRLVKNRLLGRQLMEDLLTISVATGSCHLCSMEK